MRRELITKRSYDEEQASKEISRLKRELKMAKAANGKKQVGSGGLNTSHASSKENVY